MPLANIQSYAKDGAVADKAALWTYPETSDGWYRIHNTIKAEMAKFSAGIEACKPPSRRGRWTRFRHTGRATAPS